MDSMNAVRTEEKRNCRDSIYAVRRIKMDTINCVRTERKGWTA